MAESNKAASIDPTLWTIHYWLIYSVSNAYELFVIFDKSKIQYGCFRQLESTPRPNIMGIGNWLFALREKSMSLKTISINFLNDTVRYCYHKMADWWWSYIVHTTYFDVSFPSSIPFHSVMCLQPCRKILLQISSLKNKHQTRPENRKHYQIKWCRVTNDTLEHRSIILC